MSENHTVRVFVSSPSDVRPERLIAERVVKRLAREFSYHFRLEAVLWEREPLLATHHFQDLIVPPHETDIVVTVLWSRLGVALPEGKYLGAISKTPVTGTEWEFEDAVASYQQRGLPELLLYRKRAKVTVELGDRAILEEQQHQSELVEEFMRHWFRSLDGKSFVAASREFADATEFESLLEEHLRALLSKRLSKPGDIETPATITWHQGSPYRGLEPFEIEHAPIFFGRMRVRNEIREVLARQIERGCSFVLVTGASGSGKSSLVKAGVLPDLLLPGMVGRVALCRYAVTRPGATTAETSKGVLAALSQAFFVETALPEVAQAPLEYTPDRLRELFDEAPTQSAQPIRQGLSAAGQKAGLTERGEARLVLVIDQLEELFTAGITQELRERYIAALDALARSGLVWIIATMRSDFFDRIPTLPSLAALSAGEGTYLLAPPDAADIGQIIRLPARETGLRFEIDERAGHSLDEVIREAAAKDPASLPLLEYLLDQLWHQRSAEGVLTFRSYDSLKGLEGAIGERAEQVLRDLPDTVRQAFPTVLRALVTVGQSEAALPTARLVPLSTFPEGTAERSLIEALIHPQARILVAYGDGSAARVRVAHEALLTHWERAGLQIAADRRDLRIRARIEEDEARWREAQPQDRAGLLLPPGRRLAEGEELLARRGAELDSPVVTFIEASVRVARRREAAEREEQERRIRDAEQIAAAQKRITQRTRIGLAVALLLLAGAGSALVYAGLQWWSAQKSTISALIQSSEANFAGNEDWDALMASLRAVQKLRATPLVEHFDPDIRSQISQSLQQVLYRIQEYKRLKYEVNGDISRPRHSAVGQIDWSPDGKSVAFLSGRDEVTWWRPDSNTRGSILTNKGDAKNDDEVRSVGWRPPNGETLATSSKNGRIKFFDPQGKQSFPSINLINDQDFYGISWRPDGQELALASFSYGVVVLKPDGTRLDSPLNLKHQVWSVSWSPEPQHLLAAGGFLGTVMWQNPDDASSPCSAQLGQVLSMSWSPDGKSLAGGFGNNATISLLSDDCKERNVLTGHTEVVSGVSWSSDWRLAIASEQDRTVRLWDKEGTLLDTFHIPTVRGGLQWRPDGQVLATVDQYGLVRLWKENPLLKTFTARRNIVVKDAALSPDGQILASASNEGINLWRQDHDHKWLSEPNFLPSSGVNSVNWSPDGRLLASTSYDAVTIWKWDGTSKQTLQHEHVGNGVRTVSWRPDGKAVATGDGNSNITLWDINNGFILSQTMCGDWAQTIAWNPTDDRLLAVGCHNRGGAYLLEWKPHKKEIHETQLLKEADIWSTNGILGVSWSNDGQILATSGNNLIKLWGRDGKHIRTLDTGDEVGKVAWSPDGQMLAVASGNVVKLWARDGRLVTVLKGHARAVTSVTWNKQTLVSASDDGTVKLWQIDRGFADNLLDTLLVHSCNWFGGYLEKNPLVSKEDSDLQDLCSNAQTAAAPPTVPLTNEKPSPAPESAQPPAAHEPAARAGSER